MLRARISRRSRAPLVDVERGRVQVSARTSVVKRDAQPQQAAGNVGEIAGEVFAAHAGQRDRHDSLRPHHARRRGDADACHDLVVDDAIKSVIESQVD